MTLRRTATLCLSLCALLGVTEGRADDLTSQQPSYTRIGSLCGEDPSKPSFSMSDYANAMKDATKALKEAKQQGNKDRRAAIEQSVAQMKECQKEEERKFTIPPMRNCRQFVDGYKSFSARAATLISAGKITETDRARVREFFRKPAEECIRDMMTKCIDPLKTSDVDFVIDAMQAASEFGFIFTYRSETGIGRFITITNPGFLRMTFCTDTDYACKGNREACDRRIKQIKAIMETYIRK